MKLAWILLLVSALVPIAPAPALTNDLSVKKLTFTIVRNGRDASGPVQDSYQQTLYLAPDGRELLDSNDQAMHKHTIQITLSNGQMYSLDTTSKTYSVTSQADMRSRVNHNLSKNDLGLKTIEGFQCHGAINSSPAGSIEHWWCSDPASGGRQFLGEMNFRKADGSGWRQVLAGPAQNVKVPEAFFDIPADYRSVASD